MRIGVLSLKIVGVYIGAVNIFVRSTYVNPQKLRVYFCVFFLMECLLPILERVLLLSRWICGRSCRFHAPPPPPRSPVSTCVLLVVGVLSQGVHGGRLALPRRGHDGRVALPRRLDVDTETIPF